ncbi:MAG: stage III sporulation protein AA [Huintestinicola sp.]
MESSVLRYFGGYIGKALAQINDENICEIRLRANGPLCVTGEKGAAFVTSGGLLTSSHEGAVKVTAEDIRRSFEAVCRYSVYSCQNQINNGFITVSGGHRAGICGSAVYSPSGSVENIRNISGINFRIAHEIIGSADSLAAEVFGKTELTPRSLLICGAPCSGKTTVLRDLCRIVGDRFPVSLIDERGELAAVSGGIPHSRVGVQTDVFSGYSKPDGIKMAVRVMSPVMIFCDEIGSEEDLKALELAALSGVKIAATVHCSSPDELSGRSELMSLIKKGIFDSAAFMVRRRTGTVLSREKLMALDTAPHGAGRIIRQP